METTGHRFRQLVSEESPLQVLGTVNAYSAIIAKRQGVKAIYLSGGGVAACSLGIPDLGITTLNDVLTDAKRITNACDLPLLADIDVGWGGLFNIARTIKEMISSGVAAVHIEDQIAQKRCGHRPNKQIVPKEEMTDRIKAAVDARTDNDFVIMARTDSIDNEGQEKALERIYAYIDAGADMIFPEAVYTLEQYQYFRSHISVPILANITEFGKTPLFTKEELANTGVDIILYPLSIFRAMSKSAIALYDEIITKGTQKDALKRMQTREELYDYLGYHNYETKLDNFLNES
ncbi:2-methylisocitrate lyase [Elysia marginata]|uniref:2-methylisocitrate lyase n=1 Tax=Elysia marginata TaxID=1093978 RepID=A0AAV4JSM3_9GAST|nr:2-methylisocitrate lyase [Elysia marginata]